MTSSLSAITADKRRRLARTLGLFAVLFIAVGAVAATGASGAGEHVLAVAVLLLGLVLALMSWGVLRSVRLEADEARVQAAVESAVRAGGGQLCGCGHDHDPDEMHVVHDDGQAVHDGQAAAPEFCPHDGSRPHCGESCATCLVQPGRTSPL